LLREKNRVVYTSRYRERGKPHIAVNVVTLYPRKAWHLDCVDDDQDHNVDDILTELGPRKTKLDVIFTERFKIRGGSSRAEAIKNVSGVWEKFVVALERDYSRQK
jgi:hypothetical protein